MRVAGFSDMMSPLTVRNAELQLAQLRPLLHLSRELLQPDEAAGSLELIGTTLADMLNMDCAIPIMRTQGN